MNNKNIQPKQLLWSWRKEKVFFLILNRGQVLAVLIEIESSKLETIDVFGCLTVLSLFYFVK
jgi:hypothetical protein